MQKPGGGTESPAPQYPIESVDNALKLVLLLGERPEIRMSEASRYLGVASSTAHRLLAMLQYRGFVRQDPVVEGLSAGSGPHRGGVRDLRPPRHPGGRNTGHARPQ